MLMEEWSREKEVEKLVEEAREEGLRDKDKLVQEGQEKQIIDMYLEGGITRQYALSRLQLLSLPTPAEDILDRWDREREQNGRSEQ